MKLTELVYFFDREKMAFCGFPGGLLQRDGSTLYPAFRENAEIKTADTRTAKTNIVQNTTSPFIVPPH